MAAAREATILRLDDGRLLAYAEYGDPSGAPVFGFHGTPGSYRLFGLLDDAAARLGIRLIAPDRPGYGFSDYLPDRRLLDWPRDVTALAGALGLERFGVVGISGGGPHAAVCAHQLGARLLGAAIVCGIAPTLRNEDSEGMMPVNRLLTRLARRSLYLVWPIFALMGLLMRHFGAAMFPRFIRSLPESDQRAFARPEVRDAFLEEQRRAPRSAALAAAQDFALFTRPWGFRLEEIASPVHVFFGELDVNVPAAHGRMQADRIPNAKVHYFRNEAHLLFVEHGEELLLAAAGRDAKAAS
jgi:pimeloyl-ACP methyl ester carboxylesterase